MHWKDCDKPTQSLYHIPTQVLKPSANMVVLFEEAASALPRDLDGIKLVAVHQHPAM